MGARSYNSSSSSSSSNSGYSAQTQSTAPTAYSNRRPSVKHYDTCLPDLGEMVAEPQSYDDELNRRSSIDTYASTTASDEDLSAQPTYELPTERHKTFHSDAVPSTPPEFADLFPSTRRLLIKHDDSTSDGNMNLRIDTEISTSRGRRIKMTLFHLRMRDLHERHFSLRRYCRESGREVCHSAKKYVKPPPAAPPRRRPTLQSSLTNAIQTLTLGKKPPPRRCHSGYQSDDEDQEPEDDLREFTASADVKPTVPTNIVRLDFANYAQVELHRHRTSTEKEYDFEYWGSEYRWSRSNDTGHSQRHSFFLVNMTSGTAVAHIIPERLSRDDAFEEEHNGGWVPPCRMEITDRSIADELKADLADVIVATGLIALADDSIKRHWHSNKSVRMSIPRKGTQGYVEPDRLIDEVFHRPAPAIQSPKHRPRAQYTR